MNLLYDRRRSHRHTVSFGSDSNVGSNSERAELPVGRYSEPGLRANLSSYRWLFEQIGEALYGYVQPNRSTKRPKVMNALSRSLCGTHEACRASPAPNPTTTFAASIDRLKGGQEWPGIPSLRHARLGSNPYNPTK